MSNGKLGEAVAALFTLLEAHELTGKEALKVIYTPPGGGKVTF